MRMNINKSSVLLELAESDKKLKPRPTSQKKNLPLLTNLKPRGHPKKMFNLL
jgi:hypothetical protein